jgi:MFS family permease
VNDGAASTSGAGHALARYRSVLAIPHVRPSVLTALLGRIPIGMIGLTTVLLIRQQTGSYAVAGAVAAAYAISAGVVAPALGRLIDNFGIPRVIVPLAIAQPIALAILIAAAHADATDALLVAAGVLGGLVNVPLFAAIQSLLTSLAEPYGAVESAFALEAVLQEIVFLGGPVLVAVLVAVGSPTLAMVACGVLTLVGGLLFSATPGARQFRAKTSEHNRLIGALASPGVRTIAAVGLASGVAFGSLEVSMPAFAGEHGSAGTAGVLLGAIALGSIVGGLWHGTRSSAGSPIGRYLVYVWLLALALVPVALAGSIGAMFAAALIGGFFLAPSYAVELTLISRLAPAGKMTEAFTWLTLAIVIGIAAGNALSGVLVEGPGVTLALTVPSALMAIAAAIATIWRSTLVVRS